MVKFIFRSVGVFLIAIGIAALFFGFQVRVSEAASREGPHIFEGRIISIEPFIGYGADSPTDLFTPTITYETVDGETRTFTSSMYGPAELFPVGSTVSLRNAVCVQGYECEPMLTSNQSDFFAEWGLLMIGAVFGLVGLLLLFRPPSEFGDQSGGAGSL